MTDLPDINYFEVAKKLAYRLSEQALQVAALEQLSESLRTQRDEALNIVDSYQKTAATAAHLPEND